jgi:RHS repeat-associated protein
MGCLKLSYQPQERVLERTSLFLEKGLEKKGSAIKNRVRRYRYGFNGMEKDEEVKGNGNSLDFGARIYDSRLGRMLGIDPLTQAFPSENPYLFSGGNPIAMVDEEGEKKTYYITKIAKNVTTTLTVVNKYEVEKVTVSQRQKMGVPGLTLMTSPEFSNTYTYDLKQEIIINEDTGEITYGKEERDVLRSNNSAVRYVEDNAEETGHFLDKADNFVNGGGGIVFTSGIGQGQETRQGFNADDETESIDLLISVLGAASSAAGSQQAKNFIHAFKQGVDGISISYDVNGDIIQPGVDKLNQGGSVTPMDSCTNCRSTGERGTLNPRIHKGIVPVGKKNP